MGQPSIVGGPGLQLRPFEAGDVRWVMAAFEEPDIQRWHLRRLDGVEEAERWVAHWAKAWAAETEGNWLITRAATGERLGQLGLRGVDLGDGRAEISYWLSRGARGAGVAVGAVGAVADWLFDRLGLRRLEIVHSVQNPASCRVATHAGFSLEGTMRDSLRHTDGWHDMHLHARVAGDA